MRFDFVCQGCYCTWSMMWTPFKPMPACLNCGDTLEFDDRSDED